jgi:light-regulated signal transduction histidine kinase (bacteriophytochrome)
LFGVSGSLQIEFTLADMASASLQSPNEKKEQEIALRKAFIEICLNRAEVAAKDGIRTEAMVSGDFYLNHHEIRDPLKPAQTLEPKVGPTSQQGIHDTTKSEPRANAKRRET